MRSRGKVVIAAACVASALISAHVALAVPASDLAFIRGGHVWKARLSHGGGGASLSGEAAVLAAAGRKERSPAWVPGQAEVIFASEASPAASSLPAGSPAPGQLWKVFPDGPDPISAVQVTRAGLTGQANSNGVGVSTVSGDGSRFAFDFRSVTSSSMWWQTPRLYRVPASAGVATVPTKINISSGAPAAEPAWWPSGGLLAVSREDIGDDYNNVWLVSTSGVVTTKLTNATSAARVRWERPAWSPSGEWLTASRMEGTKGALWKMRIDGTLSSRLTTPAADQYDQASAWTADGSLIVFERYDGGAGTHSLYAIHSTPQPGDPVLLGDGAEPATKRAVPGVAPAVRLSASVSRYSPAVRGVYVQMWTDLPGGPGGASVRSYMEPAGSRFSLLGTRPLGRTSGAVRRKITSNTMFYSVWDGQGSNDAAGGSAMAYVRPYLSMSSARSVSLGSTLWVFAQLRPAHNGKWLRLQRLVGTKWKTVMSKKLTKAGTGSTALFGYRPNRRGIYKLRTYFGGDADHYWAASSARTTRVW
jgi:hypothetical protein